MKSISKDGVRLDNSGYLSTQTKQQAIDLLAAGKKPAYVSKELGIHIESIKRWAKEAS